ncbi:MAG: hypothetical protein M3Y87_27525 [Myxococcota bacterium]|nr:hypothetical protein [Myxococcota bacterium]
MRSRSGWLRVGASFLALVGGAACSPTVGDTCDEDLARTPYYRTADGAPAYPGQALLLENCASCHNDSGLEADDPATEQDESARVGTYGAPLGLEMNLGLVTAADDAGLQQARRLLARQATVHRHRDLIYSQVVSGAMPPRGFVPENSLYVDAAGAPMPGIRTPEGQELLRNWLACDSPVVERTTAVAQPCTAHADCPVTNFCDSATSQCVGVGDVVPSLGTVDCEVPEPTWQWVYPCVMVASCSGAICHVGGASGGLAMDTIDSAYDALVNAGPSPAPNACAAATEPYIEPGMPEASLLIHKLDGVDDAGETVCGSRMPVGVPLTPEQDDALRMWIMDGAME